MRHSPDLAAQIGYEACRYGQSPLVFRGPAKLLDGSHISFIGGSETFGRFVKTPYVSLIEAELSVTCINLSQINGSIDAALHDSFIPYACREGSITVVAAMSAANVSNRLYSVHPRRNDRFIRPSPTLLAIYHDVDFTEICFTGHLLERLHHTSPERFQLVKDELQAAWLARMRTLLDRIGRGTILVLPSFLTSDVTLHRQSTSGWLGSQPLFVTREMAQSLRTYVRAVVDVEIPADIASTTPFGEDFQLAMARALTPHLRS